MELAVKTDKVSVSNIEDLADFAPQPRRFNEDCQAVCIRFSRAGDAVNAYIVASGPQPAQVFAIRHLTVD